MRPTAWVRRELAITAVACLALGLASAPASAVAGDPLFVFRPTPPPLPLPPLIPPPAGKFEGPCGLAVDAAGNFYVSDYYHHAIDVYTSDVDYLTQRANEDPQDGPCGLAIGPAGNVYVNNFHRNVVRFGSASGFGVGTVIAGVGADTSHPTGVAVDGTGTVFVDERDRVATVDAAGLEGEPIGVSSLENGYGVAVSAYPGSAGFVYVPDASSQTVKIFDPATSRTDPVAEIDGSGTPLGRFVSLRDASVAVDDVSGAVYVVDDLTPEYKEGHEAVVYVFDAAGAYLGRLKYSVQTALPAGLAVDNSATSTQGRVYVTSGYTELAAVYAYPPGSAGSAAVPLASAALTGVPSSNSAPVATHDASTAVSPAPAAASQPQAAAEGAPLVGSRIQLKRHPKRGRGAKVSDRRHLRHPHHRVARETRR